MIDNEGTEVYWQGPSIVARVGEMECLYLKNLLPPVNKQEQATVSEPDMLLRRICRYPAPRQISRSKSAHHSPDLRIHFVRPE